MVLELKEYTIASLGCKLSITHPINTKPNTPSPSFFPFSSSSSLPSPISLSLSFDLSLLFSASFAGQHHLRRPKAQRRRPPSPIPSLHLLLSSNPCESSSPPLSPNPPRSLSSSHVAGAAGTGGASHRQCQHRHGLSLSHHRHHHQICHSLSPSPSSFLLLPGDPDVFRRVRWRCMVSLFVLVVFRTKPHSNFMFSPLCFSLVVILASHLGGRFPATASSDEASKSGFELR